MATDGPMKGVKVVEWAHVRRLGAYGQVGPRLFGRGQREVISEIAAALDRFKSQVAALWTLHDDDDRATGIRRLAGRRHVDCESVHAIRSDS